MFTLSVENCCAFLGWNDFELSSIFLGMAWKKKNSTLHVLDGLPGLSSHAMEYNGATYCSRQSMEEPSCPRFMRFIDHLTRDVQRHPIVTCSSQDEERSRLVQPGCLPGKHLCCAGKCPASFSTVFVAGKCCLIEKHVHLDLHANFLLSCLGLAGHAGNRNPANVCC